MSDRPKLRLALEIEDPRWAQALPDIAELLEKAIALALAEVDDRSRTIEVSVRLVDDGTIQGLNRDWRGRDKPTNVLSFPMGDPAPVDDPEFPWLIGDIVMSFDTMKAEAERDLSVGGPELAGQALHAGLVDECQLFLVPVAVGGGRPALPPGLRLDLELLDQRRFGNGTVYLRYAAGQ